MCSGKKKRAESEKNMDEAKHLKKETGEKLHEASVRNKNALGAEAKCDLRKMDLDKREEDLDLREAEIKPWEDKLKKLREQFEKDQAELKEREEKISEKEIYYASLDEWEIDYSNLKNASSMKELEIDRLNGELKYHKVPGQEPEAFMPERRWFKEDLKEMRGFSYCKARYVQTHNEEDRNGMFQNFFAGVNQVVCLFYEMCKRWTPSYLRKLARMIEDSGYSNYAAYHKHGRSSEWER